MKYTKLFQTKDEMDEHESQRFNIRPNIWATIDSKNITYTLKGKFLDLSEFPNDVLALNGPQKVEISPDLIEILDSMTLFLRNQTDDFFTADFQDVCKTCLYVKFDKDTFLGEAMKPTYGNNILLEPQGNSIHIGPKILYDYENKNIYLRYACFVYDTDILLASREIKKVQDITYNDDLLVWDFDNGCYTSSKPLWIKKEEKAVEYYKCTFKNGTQLNLVGSNGNCHRIFNYTDGRFDYATDCVGKEIYTINGITELVKVEKINEPCLFYNIVTEYHMNLFANNVLTSCRYSNLYPIVDMKYIKDDRKLKSNECFGDIPYKYINGMRLKEQNISDTEIIQYIRCLENLKV